MTAALWVIALCQVGSLLLSARAKGIKGPLARLRERNKPERRPVRVTEMP